MSQESGRSTKYSKITVAAAGDSMITRQISPYRGMESILDLFRIADVRFTNVETLFHRGESYAMPGTFATRMYADPSVARELKWVGFNLVALCNNHSMDYGPSGMQSTMKALHDVDIVTAGTGRDLDEAREPRYLETPNGRVALIAGTWSDHEEGWHRASNMNSGIPPRPGTNLFQVRTTYYVTKEQFKVLKELIVTLGIDPPSGMIFRRTEDEISLFRHPFRVGDKVEAIKTIRRQDFEDSIKTIEDARKTADWVLVSFHTHDCDPKGAEHPSVFVREYARACIHAGADAFLCHGAHFLQGIEIHEKRPIFYSLGNFLIQDEIMDKVTFDQYEFFGLGRNAKPSDFFKARAGMIPPGAKPYSDWWNESAIPVFELGSEGLKSLKLYPITMDPDEKSLVQRGRPHIDTTPKGISILERLQELSSEFNTNIEIINGIGNVKI